MKVDVVQYMCSKHLKKYIMYVATYVDLQFYYKNFELIIFLATSLLYIHVYVRIYL